MKHLSLLQKFLGIKKGGKAPPPPSLHTQKKAIKNKPQIPDKVFSLFPSYLQILDSEQSHHCNLVLAE